MIIFGSYQVVAQDGTVYNNIFETFVDPGLLSVLRRTTNPMPTISERVPVYNYCHEIIGYTEVISQEANFPESEGEDPPTSTNEPGYKAGGLPT